MEEHHLTTRRTARYYTLGGSGPLREVWFVLHGYGQQAGSFVRHFRSVAAAHRLVVAPEALARFYLEPGNHEGRIGASWMTREDRLAEIDDYVAYLDTLYAHIFEPGARQAVAVHVLGFSQGAATACRWQAYGAVRAEQLTLWGGRIPPDLDLTTHRAAFAQARLTLIAGTEDEYAKPERIAEQEARLSRHDLPFRSLSFEGGHRLDSDVLRTLV